MKSPGLLLAALLALGVVTPHTARASLVLELSSVDFEVSPDLLGGAFANGFTAGWSFTTNTDITVTALDAWNPNPAGTEVRIYSIIPGDFINGGGSLTDVASAIVTASDPETGSPVAFHSHSIDPITLHATAGTDETYYIVQFVAPGGSTETTSYSQIVTDPSIHYGFGVSAVGGGYPTEDLNVGAFGAGYFGPNFEIAPQTPEPASLWSLAGGLALLAFFRRHRRAIVSVSQ